MTVVPAADDVAFEADDDPAGPARTAGPGSAARRPAPADDDGHGDDRAARRRRRDEDGDRPRRRPRASAKAGGPSVVLLAAVAAGGVGLVAVLGVAAYLVFGGKATGPGGVLGPAPPAGYSVVGGSPIGMTLFLPGEVRGDFVRRGHLDGPPDPDHYAAQGVGGDPMGRLTARRSPGFKPGTSPDQLYAVYESGPLMFAGRPRKYEATGKKPVTLGGKPGLEFRVKELPDLWDDTPHKKEFFKEFNERERQRVVREGRYYVVLVAVNDEWTYVISIDRKEKPVDDGVVKTVSESITFN